MKKKIKYLIGLSIMILCMSLISMGCSEKKTESNNQVKTEQKKKAKVCIQVLYPLDNRSCSYCINTVFSRKLVFSYNHFESFKVIVSLPLRPQKLKSKKYEHISTLFQER